MTLAAADMGPECYHGIASNPAQRPCRAGRRTASRHVDDRIHARSRPLPDARRNSSRTPAPGCSGPERPDNWRDGALPAQRAFAAVASAIATSEPVTMGVSARSSSSARESLPPAVRVVEMSTERRLDARRRPDLRRRPARARCAASTGGSTPGAALRAALYSPGTSTTRSRRKVLEIERCDRYRAPFVLEGGAIHVDGRGHAADHRGMPAEPEPQPDAQPRADREPAASATSASREIIWLGRGVFNDETDGHVDNLCCFVRPGVVVLTWSRRPGRSAVRHLARGLRGDCRGARDARGRTLKIHKLLQPGPLYMTEAEAAGIEQVAGMPSRAVPATGSRPRT